MSIIAVGACAPEPQAALAITQARFKLPLPGKTVSAGYFELHNSTSRAETLVRVAAEVGSSVEIHRTVQRGDRVSMERIHELPLAPGSQLSFAPGGYHLMLFGIETLPAQTRVTLHFASGTSLTATFDAERW
ncbi:MAG: copper chaperone PCu(A)C [Pseudomonadales bacterium]